MKLLLSLPGRDKPWARRRGVHVHKKGDVEEEPMEYMVFIVTNSAKQGFIGFHRHLHSAG